MGYREAGNGSYRSRAPAGPEVVDGSPAQDLDGDGLYEDVNGDGEAAAGDADVLFQAIFDGNPAVMNNPEKFDFNQDGDVTTGDADVLFDLIFNDEVGPGTNGLDTGGDSGGDDDSSDEGPTLTASLSLSEREGSWEQTTRVNRGEIVPTVDAGESSALPVLLIDGTKVNEAPTAVPAGESDSVPVRFRPDEIDGASSATIEVRSETGTTLISQDATQNVKNALRDRTDSDPYGKDDPILVFDGQEFGDEAGTDGDSGDGGGGGDTDGSEEFDPSRVTVEACNVNVRDTDTLGEVEIRNDNDVPARMRITWYVDGTEVGGQETTVEGGVVSPTIINRLTLSNVGPGEDLEVSVGLSNKRAA